MSGLPAAGEGRAETTAIAGQLDALDRATLTSLVERLLGRGPVELVAWRWDPIPYDMFLPWRTLARFSGTALVAGETTPWSLVLKHSPRPIEYEGAVAYGWQREPLAYRSGLLDDLGGGLSAARAIAIDEDATGAIWLWLEDLTDRYGPRWPLAQYGRAARHLGRFNGTYLATRSLPDYPWLRQRWADVHSAPDQLPTAIEQVAALAHDPRVAGAFPGYPADRLVQLLTDQPAFKVALDRLPQTLCHHDASRPNLFARRLPNGRIGTVAIDWESLGPGAVGAEIAPLVSGTVRRGHIPAEWIAALDRAVFAGYLRGLRDAGWQGDADRARLGYTAAIALRWFVLRDMVRTLTETDARPVRRGLRGESSERAFRQLILLTRYLLARADEARDLARQLRLW